MPEQGTPIIDSLMAGQPDVQEPAGGGGGFGALIGGAKDTLFGVSPEKEIENRADSKAQKQYVKELKTGLIEDASDLARARAQAWYGKGVFNDDDLREVLEGIAQRQTKQEGDQETKNVDEELRNQEAMAAQQQHQAMIAQATAQGYPPGSEGFTSLMQPAEGPQPEQGDILSQLVRGLG